MCPKATFATKARLEATDWIEAALRILPTEGVDGLRLDRLAKQLGVTKGSFYAHFRDRDALLEALLGHWRQHATLDIIDRLERRADAQERLDQLLRLPFRGPKSDRYAGVELAIRLWSRSDSRASSALAEVDRLRLRYLEKWLKELGFSAKDASARAVCSYCFMRVAGTLLERSEETLLEACMQLLLGA